MDKYKTDYQLVPPDNHKRNLAERAIQTLKIHFKTIISTNGILCMLMQTKKETGKAYIDLTGRFPIRSARGNE